MALKDLPWFQGIIGIVLLLVGYGGSEFLTVDIVENTFVCNANDNLGVFPGSPEHPKSLSGTAGTGYWVDEGGNNRRSRCSGGWQQIDDYDKDNGVDPESYLVKVNEEPEVVTVTETVIEYVPTGNTIPIVYTCSGEKYRCNKFGNDADCIRDDEMLLPYLR